MTALEIENKEIVTHNGVFHADEVTAIALLSLFGETLIVPERLNHQTQNFDGYDFVIDIGRKFDGVKWFDHHQHQGGKASAGLIWDYIQNTLGIKGKYPKIDSLIEMADRHDTGEKKAGDFEYPMIIASYNSEDIYSPLQDEAFMEAVKFAIHFIGSLKKSQDAVSDAAKVVEESKNLKDEGLPDIVELKQFHRLWNTQLNGETTPEIEAVVWFDEKQKNWQAQVTPKKAGSFEFNGRKFLPDDSMEFVHAAGFFAVAKDRDTIISFLKNSRETK